MNALIIYYFLPHDDVALILFFGISYVSAHLASFENCDLPAFFPAYIWFFGLYFPNRLRHPGAQVGLYFSCN